MTRKFLIIMVVCFSLIMCASDITCKASSGIVPPEGFDIDIPVNHEGSNRVYIHSVTYPINSGGNEPTTYVNSQAVGNGEIVGYVGYTEINGALVLRFASADAFDYRRRVASVDYSGNVGIINAMGHDCTSPGTDGIYWHDAENVMSTDKKMMTQTFATNTYIFDSYANAKAYLETGVLNGVIQEPSKEYDGEQIYFDSFDMVVHDSNNFDNFYVEFVYKPSQYCLDNINDCYFNINVNWLFNYSFISGLADVNLFEYMDNLQDNWQVELSLYPSSYKLYLNELYTCTAPLPIKSLFIGWIMGDEFLLDLDKLNILGVGGSNIAKIDESKLEFNIDLLCNGVYGSNYKACVDLLDASKSYTYSSTPDEEGNYQYNDDVKQSEVSNITVGGASVNQSNTQTVTFPNTLNVNINQGNNLPNVTIEDDDMSFSSLVDALKSGFGIIDDVDTGIKGDGFPAMLSYLYNGLPDAFTKIILLGVSSVTAIAILLRLFGRK